MSTLAPTIDPGPRAVRTVTKEFATFDEQCPVIPCFFTGGGKVNFKTKPVIDEKTKKQKVDENMIPPYEELPATKENIKNVRYNHPGKSFEKQYGWETWRIVPGEGPNAWKAIPDPNGVVYIMPDGYCEIAKTENNIKKFQKLVAARHKNLENGRRAPGFKTKGGKKTMIHPSFIEPPLYQKAAARKDLGKIADSTLHDLIRPWLRPFVKTDKDAGMIER
jgi:hypothetical protein